MKYKELLESEKDIKDAMDHEDKPGEGAKKRKKLSPKDKFETVMKEFGRRTLHSGSGEKVTDQKQALAIAYSEKEKHAKK